MAIMFVRAQVISRGAGRSIVSAAAYRHRARMMDEQAGTSFSYRGGAGELRHEELALPNQIPAWLRSAIEGKTVAEASEALWNAVDAFEIRADAQLARELIIALPEELTRAENIALVQEFVRDNLTSKGMIADWVYHDKDGNPHIHLMTALRPLAEEGFGRKKVPVLGHDGEPLRVATPDRPNGRIVYKLWAGDKETMKAWKVAWAQTANRHLALADHDIRLDGRSYVEQGLDGIGQKHLGPEKAALARKGVEMYFAPATLARRQEMADRLFAEPELLLKQISNERSTFDEKDIARTLHRYVDDPADFANIRARLLTSDDLVLLKPQQVDRQTGKAIEPAIYTTREILRVEYDMAQSAEVLSKRKGFGLTAAKIVTAVQSVETANSEKPFRLDQEQIDAIRHIAGDSAIAAVVGLAGAGKSTLLAAARVAWEHEYRRVFGAALAGKAAEGLEDSSGIKSRTLAAWELAWENGRDLLKGGDIFVIDEAGMVSSQQMARVLQAVENAGAKVVLVGDAMQLQPIQAGAAFRAIAERIGFAELAGVRRQREAWARDASRLLARGNVEEGLDAYAQKGHIVEAEHRAEAVELLVTDWSEARQQAIARSQASGQSGRLRGDEMLVLAHTNEDVKRLNECLRIVMNREGALTNAREFRTERGVREFASGDRIIFLENARFVEKRAKQLGPQYVKNGMLGTVVSTGGKGGRPLLSIRLDNGQDVVLSEDSYRNIDHGYAATIHKSQGVTVDRTFVLATGMMDQHLTYVSMTRHRDRADLYAARDDFEPKPQWGRKSRVDHAAGVSGEFVETGMAKFRPQDKDADESPYVDVKRDDGTVHRLWGVSLPKALSDGGVSEGDTALLRKDGVEIVMVKILVTDKETGRKSFEEREVERNIWTAKKLETAAMRRERIERESHRPELFGQLVERLGRSGAKTTTLDFENEAGYRAHAHDFARRRGIDTLAGMVAGIEERVRLNLARLDDKRGQVTKLWERASVALDIKIERDKSVSYHEGGSQHLAARSPETSERQDDNGLYLIAPTTRFGRSLEEAARRAQLRSDRWKKREVILRPVLEKIYSNPDGALARLNALASNRRIKPRRLADDLAAMPQRLGRMHGANSLIEGLAVRNERKAAFGALSELVPLARAHATEFHRQADRFGMREKQGRACMALSIPALSKPAMARLVEIEKVRERGGPDAYKTAFAHAAEDRLLVQEVKAVNEALTARFGWSAFTNKADTVAERNILERMPENLDSDRREKLARLFFVVRHFAEEQHLTEKKDRSKMIAAASVEPGKESNPHLPMLAAVREFKMRIEDEAQARALAANHYGHNRAALAEAASRIWRDPAGVVDKIESLLVKGIAGERIAAAVANDPAAYGALRGSDRIMDKLLASGRERKEALLTVPAAESHVRSLSDSYATALSNETKAINGERQRMGIAIPGLSPAADEALCKLTQTMKKKGASLKAEAGRVDPDILQEFATVSRVLDLRFGYDAVRSGEKNLINSIPPSQRRAFETMQERLKVLQQTVRMQASEQIVAERQRRALDRGTGVIR
ncbi:Ti-type conjugative transfer relaxase TraA [Brucella anthropi]|uniref:Ti-type conjugative transfer relaxase TraA n=1 Tax=Brucella anthropi TaxID=529 RepID=UPI00235EF2B5|nr:Ti-type conjugative transfer relaxase TraA [Brucella anthropi]